MHSVGFVMDAKCHMGFGSVIHSATIGTDPCPCKASWLGRMLAVRISDGPKVEHICSTLLGYFPSKPISAA